MDEVKVSVIIPTYCPKEYLWTCLDSLVNQSLDNSLYEIIIVLNGCCEPYETEIIHYIDKHHETQFELITTKEGGVSNARNIGIEKGRGEYVAFIDDDDYVSSSYLEELLGHSDRETIGLAYPFAFIDGKDNRQLINRITEEYNRKNTDGKIPFYTARRYFSGPCMKLIHRDIIGSRRFDKRFKNGEDTLFMFLISDTIKYVGFTSREAIYYRRFRENSATTSQRTMTTKIKDNWTGIKTYIKIYLSNPKEYKFSFFLTRVIGAFRGMIV